MDLLKDIQNRKDMPDDIKKKVTQFIIKCRKREKELLQANTIISRSPVVAFLWKNEVGWPVEYVSENVERLFGYTVEEFLSGEVMYIQIIHTEDIERVIAEVEDNSREGGLQSFTHKPYRIKIKYGEAKWIEDTTFIRRDCHGAISHYEGIIQDITERKQAEESFLQLQKLESLGEMAGGIAHDFNNLLAGIMGNTSIALLDGKNSIEQKKLLEKVIIASKRATNLTQQLLTFAKGGIPAMKVTSIAEIIEESVSLVLGQSSQVKCELNLPKDLWLSEINTSQIGQVLSLCIL